MRSHPLQLLAKGAICGAFVVFITLCYDYAYGYATCDSTYAANHPRLLFTPADLPTIQSRVTDGGYDDDAFDWLRFLADDFFPVVSMATKMRGDFGRWATLSLGAAAHLVSPVDTASILTGREIVMKVVDDYDVDFDEANSSFRLQALAFGYDMFFDECDDSLRTAVRDEMVGYLQTMTYNQGYQIFALRPYLANHSAMVAGALGLAAICLEDEADPVLLQDAMDFADTIIENLLTYQVDPGGSYKEGVNYIAWTMRYLVYYFHARKQHDGFDYANDVRIRRIEEWLPYEVLPEGNGYLNNLNDSMSHNYPLSKHTTYLDWAQSAWNSGLMAYVFEHTAGQYGINGGVDADKVGTVLWNQTLTPTPPGDVLPPAKLWADRGLYYYRTGWPTGNTSDDVVFSFFSGKFHGGHAQEDQNQFTLYGYGSRFVVDHGAGTIALQSEAHNLVLIDGTGQHGTGGSIGTDGRISESLLNGFGDYVQGDATSAYATYSEFNAPDQPVPGTDWSWGYEAGNPVLHARRNIVVVHESETPPYFIVHDDIDKDGTVHTYEWRLHTEAGNSIEIGSDPMQIVDGTARMDIYAIGPAFDDLMASLSSYNNGTLEPDSDMLKLEVSTVNPNFGFLLMPGASGTQRPVVDQTFETWGSASVLVWGGGIVDVIVQNHSGGTVTADLEAVTRDGSKRDFEDPARVFSKPAATVTTDARLLIVRDINGTTSRYLASNASTVRYGTRSLVTVGDGQLNVASDGTVLDVDRAGADFILYGPAVTTVRADGVETAFVSAAGYVLPASPPSVSSGDSPPRLPRVHAFPNPFSKSVHLRIEMDAASHVDAFVYDVGGRRVATVFRGPLDAGSHALTWNGRSDDGSAAATGVYFVRLRTGNHDLMRKISLIR